jgi:hypothetical protein
MSNLEIEAHELHQPYIYISHNYFLKILFFKSSFSFSDKYF